MPGLFAVENVCHHKTCWIKCQVRKIFELPSQPTTVSISTTRSIRIVLDIFQVVLVSPPFKDTFVQDLGFMDISDLVTDFLRRSRFPTERAPLSM